MPLRLQDYLLTHPEPLARIEDDGLYSRWPEHNATFIAQITAALQVYVAQPQAARQTRRWSLASLRARMAASLSGQESATITFCMRCADLVVQPHDAGHRSVDLYSVEAGQPIHWFTEFVRQAGNELDPALVSAEGWDRTVERTQAGDFGWALRRRWLAYRGDRFRNFVTLGLRTAVRNAGFTPAADFFYDATHAVLVWQPKPA